MRNESSRLLVHPELTRQTIGYDPLLPKDIAAKAGIQAMELEQLWPQCDFITLHTPLTEQTRGLMNDTVFAKYAHFFWWDSNELLCLIMETN
jgi:lactate dehydrogenase-like 2-hydroxyacid dehydrogenase